MSIALYYYTLFILLICMVSSALCLAAFVVGRKRIYGYSAIGFALYFFDVALVFRTDVSTSCTGSRGTAIYAVASPIESVILGAALLGTFWVLVTDYLGRPHSPAAIAVLFFTTTSAAAYLLVSDPQWREFLFFLPRALTILLLLLYVINRYINSDAAVERNRLSEHRSFFFSVFAATCLVIAWNVIFQLLIDYRAVGQESIPFHPERNFAENLVMCICAYQASARSVRLLRDRYAAPVPVNSEYREEFIQHSIASFSRAHGLSERETQIFTMVLDGMDNRQISQDLFLAVSTVKAHVHNILGKTGAANRKELIHSFWAHS